MSNFTFLYPHWLFAIVPLIGLIVWLKQRTQTQTLIAPHLAKALGLTSGPRARWALYSVGLAWLLATLLENSTVAPPSVFAIHTKSTFVVALVDL